jgi:hypothetical protein
MSICNWHLLAGIGLDRWVLGLLVEDGVGFCVEVALASQMLLLTYLVIAAVPERGTQMVQALVVEVDVAERLKVDQNLDEGPERHFEL